LEPGKQPLFGPIYNLSEPELKTLKEYIDENLAKGFIQPSKSPAGAPVFFVKKKDNSLRPVIDYRNLNSITIKNRYPLPLISELLNRLGKAKIFTKIDLRGAYNLVRIKPGDEWKTAFRCRYGHFEYLVMPFGLTNAPAFFQHLMNDVFREHLDHFVIIYLDDILIYSDSLEDHTEHVKLVLSILRKHGLYAKLEKSSFHQTQVEYLGFIISPSGITMDPSKTSTIKAWPTPLSVKDIQSFLGFANFYRRFIPNFSKLALPLTSLTKKSTTFLWTSAAQQAFDSLKEIFTSAPILIHPDTSKPFYLETDASGYALAGILSQTHAGNLHPISYWSRQMSSAERNYPVYDQELLAIYASFQHFRPFLLGAQHRITVYTDHKNLIYFSKANLLNRRQANWSTFFADYDFEILYRPGKLNGKADALSRLPSLRPSEEDSTLKEPKSLLSPDKLVGFTSKTLEILSSSFLSDLKTELQKDPFAKERLSDISKFPNFSKQNDFLLFKTQYYIPPSLQLETLKMYHDSKTSGHFGIAKTFHLIFRTFWWPKLRKSVKDFISTCEICARSKPSHHKPFGLLQPLPIPSQNWQDISMDFISELPPSKDFNAILVIVDRLSKAAHFIPTTSTLDSLGFAKLFISEIFRLHGLPKTIVSDRGSLFTSNFWTRVSELLGIERKLSTAFHPQTDGQTERVNQTLEQYLRIFSTYQQDNWSDLLPLAEFAYNNATHSGTQMSPFFANYGFHPRMDPIPQYTDKVPTAENFAQYLQDISQQLQQNLKEAQEISKYHADKKRSKPPEINVNDFVWLSLKNIKTKRPSKKLDSLHAGPFKVLRKLSEVTYHLELPPTMKIHPVFHVSLLHPANKDSNPNRQQPPPPPVIVDNEEEFQVNQILDSRIRRNKVEYLVDWTGYGPNDRTWEPQENLQDLEALDTFHQQYPNKPSMDSIKRRSGARQ